MAIGHQIELCVSEEQTEALAGGLQNQFMDTSSFPVADQLVWHPRPSKLYTSISLCPFCTPLLLSGPSVTARRV